MAADEGRMSFEEFVDIDDLPEVSRQVRPPTAQFGDRYARLQSLHNWRNVNISPDFPAVAEVLLELYDQAAGAEFDGVIVADTLVFERLSSRAGGIEVAGFGRLAPEDTLRFVGLEAYDAFDTDEERKRVLGATPTATFAELFQILEDDDVPATVQMLADIAAGGHLRLYARDAAVQPELDQVGGTERGRTVHDHTTTVRSGQQEQLRNVTRTPGGWHEVDGRVEVEVGHLPQPTLRGSALRLVVEVPAGHRVVEHGPDIRTEDGEVVWEGTASGPMSLSVVLEADGGAARVGS